MIWLWIYLGIGIANWVVFAIMNGLDLEPHTNAIYLLKDGNSRTETRKDRIIVTVVEAVFFVLFWPAQLAFKIFAYILMPIVDWFGKKELLP